MWWTLDRVIYLYFAVLGYMEAGLPLQGPRGLLMLPLCAGNPAAYLRQYYGMGWSDVQYLWTPAEGCMKCTFLTLGIENDSFDKNTKTCI